MLILEKTPQYTSAMTIQDGKLIVKGLVRDDAILQANKAYRLANSSRVSSRKDLPAHPKGAKTIYAFSAPVQLWTIEKRKYPAIFAMLHSRNQQEREMAAAAIAKKHPEWVREAPNVHKID